MRYESLETLASPFHPIRGRTHDFRVVGAQVSGRLLVQQLIGHGGWGQTGNAKGRLR
jgi:hypothetical protein